MARSVVLPGKGLLHARQFPAFRGSAIPSTTNFAVLFGPATATVGIPSALFTVQPVTAYTGTITLDDAAAGGTFTPTSLTWSASTIAQTFQYTPVAAGVVQISANGSPLITVVGSPLMLTVSTGAQFFEQALEARLNAIAEVTAIVGSAIYTQALPETHDLGTDGPALTYSIPTKPRGHVLTGGDGTATARVQVDAWSYSYGTSKRLLEAVWNGLDGVPATWGDGSCKIVSVTQQDDIDASERPQSGSDQWLYHLIQEYRVMYRVIIPNLS